MAGTQRDDDHQPLTVGWREWVALPSIDVPAIKAKIDTGARTSALHAYRIETFRSGGRHRIRFGLHPLQRRTDIALDCETDIVDRRIVSDSGGHREERYVIELPMTLGEQQWRIECTLTDRDTMLFRMLLGRSAMRGRLIVDPTRSYLMGKRPKGIYGGVFRRKKRKGGNNQ